MGRGENVEAVLGCEVSGCWFFFALSLGGVLFCELFELLFFLFFDAVVFTLIEHVSRVEGAVVGVVCIIAKSLMWSGVFLCVSASAFSCSSGCVGSERAVTAGLVWVSACFARSWSPNLIVLMRWGWNWPAEIESIGIPNRSSPLAKSAGRGVDLRRSFS